MHDSKLESLITQAREEGHINYLEHVWLKSLGATEDQVNNAWKEFLTGLGYTGSLTEMQYEWLGDMGATKSSLTDRWQELWWDLGRQH